MKRSLTVTPEVVGQRLDASLPQLAPEFNRSIWQKLIKQQQVTVNGQPTTPDYKLKTGDVLEYEQPNLEVKPIELPVIYENEQVIVFNKPAGVLTHSKGALNDEATVATSMQPFWPASESNRAGIVHRLDRWTSGVIICAKTEPAMIWLQKQFSTRQTDKRYLAVVEGTLDKPAYRLEWPIERNPKKPQTFRVGANGKAAVTEVKVIKQVGDNSVVECHPLTGRTHQLRVHLAKLGHSIVGDQLYGSSHDLNGRILLHAHQLTLSLPDGKSQTFSAPVPDDMEQYAS